MRQPLRGVAHQQGRNDQGAQRHDQQQRQQQHHLASRLTPARRQMSAERAADKQRGRQRQRQQQDPEQRLADMRRQPESGDKPDHHAGQRAHHFNRRLDPAAQSWRHKPGGVHRGRQRQRRGEQQRQRRCFQRADDHRHKAKLGLIAVCGVGGLPDPVRRGIVFIPDFLPEAAPADVRPGIIDTQYLPASGTLQQQRVAARREGGARDAGRQLTLQDRAGLLAGEQLQRAVRLQGSEDATLRFRDHRRGRAAADEGADFMQPRPFLASDGKPLRYAASILN